MKYVILFLLLTGCNHFGLYTKKDVVRINTAILKLHQDVCGDTICESSENINRPEIMLRLAAQALEWEWIDSVGTESYDAEYETREWQE